MSSPRVKVTSLKPHPLNHKRLHTASKAGKASKKQTPESSRLQEAFTFCRQHLFPRWDRKRRWRIKLDPTLDSVALCHFKKRTIFFQAVERDEITLLMLVCHEIAHAALQKRCGHGKRWQHRMLEASTDAENVGNSQLAEAIKRNAEAYTPDNSETVTPASIKNNIRDVTFDFFHGDGKVPALTTVLHHISLHSCLSVSELRRRCRGYKAAYKDTIEEIEAEEVERARQQSPHLESIADNLEPREPSDGLQPSSVT